MDEQAIIAGVDRLNGQLRTLPDDVPCSLEGLYPDFDVPECGPEMYLTLLEEEARQVKAKIDVASEGQTETLQKLLAMLLECASALWRAGVGPVLQEDRQDASPEHLAGETEISDDLQEPPASHNGHRPSQ